MPSTVDPIQIGSGAGHQCFVTAENSQLRARCECNETWTYPQLVTYEHMVSIYESHLRYFNRPKMETL